jgi:tetratricopeptide (TPR) repeat protein
MLQLAAQRGVAERRSTQDPWRSMIMKSCGLVTAGIVLLLAATGAAADALGETDDAVDRRVAGLIEQLGDQQFSVRQRAQQELIKLGFEAFDALAEAENHDDPEIAMQVSYLVRLIRADWTREGDPRQIQQILKEYEIQPDDRRLLKIKQLAELPEDEGLPWLCRLVRFEKSLTLSKQAALAIMSQKVAADEATWNRRAEVIHKALRRSKRPAAQWLSAYVQAQRDPAGALEKWSSLTEVERQTLEQHPQETQNQIVMDLLRRKIDLLERLGRSAETVDVMRQMVLCERGDSTSLTDLIDYLVERKAWSLLDEVETRFAASFEVDGLLMYTLCEARVTQGQPELAEKTAEKALKISGDSQQEHAILATRLVERGLATWADREWRQVIALGPLGSAADVIARDRLSNGLHDRGLDLEAAQLLQELLDAADKDPNIMQRIRTAQQQVETNPNLIRANMHFYLSCHAAAQGDLARRRENLDKALQLDRTNVEVLIGLYQLTESEPPKRVEIVKQIKEVIDLCRSKIEDSPDDPTFYNQIAWLVANTEGDVDDAIRLSLKSVELARATVDNRRVGGLLDTLGHCYYAKKDYENAVKYQTEAAQLDPHTVAIARQLKTFRAALERQQSGPK